MFSFKFHVWANHANRSWRGVLDTTLCDEFSQWLVLLIPPSIQLRYCWKWRQAFVLFLTTFICYLFPWLYREWLLNIRAHAILTICSFSHAPEFCGRLLYLSACSLALHYCLLFSSRLYFCWKIVSDMYTLRSMYWQLFFLYKL